MGNGQRFLADAESLGQCGISSFLRYEDNETKRMLNKQSVEGFLESQNVIINISDENAETDGYHITINGCNYEIYSEEELNEDWWKLSSVRCFSIINKLLREAGSRERIYALNEGNDQMTIFLTEDMYNMIKACHSLSEKSKPKDIGNVF